MSFECSFELSIHSVNCQNVQKHKVVELFAICVKMDSYYKRSMNCDRCGKLLAKALRTIFRCRKLLVAHFPHCSHIVLKSFSEYIDSITAAGKSNVGGTRKASIMVHHLGLVLEGVVVAEKTRSMPQPAV